MPVHPIPLRKRFLDLALNRTPPAGKSRTENHFLRQYGLWALVAGAPQGLGAAFANQLPHRLLHSAVLFVFLFVTSCSSAAASTITPASSSLATTVPTQTARAGENPPNGQTALIKVSDQEVDNGTVNIDEVVSRGPGWVVVYNTDGAGKPQQPIGIAPVKDGDNTHVTVLVEQASLKGSLYVRLHSDLGTAGVFEYPGPDIPESNGIHLVEATFKVLSASAAPAGNNTSSSSVNVGSAPGGINGQTISPTSPIPQGENAGTLVALGNTPVTLNYLVDSHGMSLYVFLLDTPGKSRCDVECLKLWSPLLASGRILAGAGVPANKLGFVLLPDRSRQVTYSGEPLYRYAKDKKPGDVNGQGQDGNWYLVIP